MCLGQNIHHNQKKKINHYSSIPHKHSRYAPGSRKWIAKSMTLIKSKQTSVVLKGLVYKVKQNAMQFVLYPIGTQSLKNILYNVCIFVYDISCSIWNVLCRMIINMYDILNCPLCVAIFHMHWIDFYI